MGGKAQKQEQAQQQQSWTNLNNLFGFASDASKSFGAKGEHTLDDVGKHFMSLLSGDRQATMTAVAPAANAIQAGSDAAKKQEADMGTGRTGGTVAANQQREDQVRAQIDNLIAGAKPAAAQSLTAIGESDVNAMLNALGLGTQATGIAGGQISSDINSRREASAKMWSSLIGGAVSLATAPLGGKAGGTLLGKVVN